MEIELHKSANLKSFFAERDMVVLSQNCARYALELSTADETLYKMLNTLFQQGHKIKDLQIHPPTLDHVFIKIARGEMR